MSVLWYEILISFCSSCMREFIIFNFIYYINELCIIYVLEK